MLLIDGSMDHYTGVTGGSLVPKVEKSFVVLLLKITHTHTIIIMVKLDEVHETFSSLAPITHCYPYHIMNNEIPFYIFTIK